MTPLKNFIEKLRPWIIIAFQAGILAAAYLGAFLLRFDGALPEEQWANVYKVLPPLLLIKLVVLWGFGLLRGWWRFVSMPDLLALLKANVGASLLLVLYVVFVHGILGFPRSVFFIDWVLSILALGGIRFATRAYREKINVGQLRQGRRALIVGAGSAGQILVREMHQNPDLHQIPVGFIDDDPEKAGHSFQGVSVLGRASSICEVVEKERAELVIIAIPSADGDEVQAVLAECRKCKVEVLLLPGLRDLLPGRVMINQLRKVGVEDLLGRKPARLDSERIASDLAGQVVLVTGAGGSIGSEICRQVASFGPETLVLFERSENNLYHIELELLKKFPGLDIVPVIGDVQDRGRIGSFMDLYRPSIVYHAAAYKHVPMMEMNPLEAVKNNVLGTRVAAEVAAKYGARKFVLISTDKAVRPTSVMGATKRAAERVFHAIEPNGTAFIAVRFGNVLWSSGSVVPIFEKQISEGGPLTVTHPEVARYFMTIPEATGLVLQAGSMGRGKELFLLDMGEPVKILDLAMNMIRLSGLEPGKDIDIEFTGLRPGEKLYEELLVDGEGMDPTEHEKILVVRGNGWEEGLIETLDAMLDAAQAGDVAATLSLLQSIGGEYTPSREIFSSLMSQRFPEPIFLEPQIQRV